MRDQAVVLLGYEGAALLTLADLQNADQLQRAIGFPDRRTSDAEDVGEFSLWGKSIPGLVCAREDALLNQIDDDLKSPSNL
ncbi:MAG: hypothetical protein A2V78_17530 [Betaproteobacteria bacterium RBG_16_64_18]|nr:MAG: hypothetical protein A2V78_17530 [Betaproteobacteria bacterium RBG_16_64_18]